MGEHRRSVTPYLGLSDAATPVGFHFAQSGHELHNMQFVILEQVKSEDPYIILARESFWIREYQAINHGLNKQK